MSEFSIGEVAARTGVPAGTLRMWERRHGFPRPQRSGTGRRSYSAAELEAIRRVSEQRAAGVTLAAAIERARSDAPGASSVHATLRKHQPALAVRPLAKPLLLALTRAIEDESLSRAEPLLLIGVFQRERSYRQSEARWRQLSRGAELAIVLSDFARPRAPRGGPVEVPLPAAHPLNREWVLICDANGFSACVAGWEAPSASGGPEPRGASAVLESLWSAEPGVARLAARVCAEIAAARTPEPAQRALLRLDARPLPPLQDQLEFANAITNRTLSYLSRAGAR